VERRSNKIKEVFMTINEALSFTKILRARKAELVALWMQCSTKTSYLGEREKIEKPQYDVKKMDRKIIEMDNALFKIDSAIKQTNADTQLKIEINVDALLSPLE